MDDWADGPLSRKVTADFRGARLPQKLGGSLASTFAQFWDGSIALRQEDYLFVLSKPATEARFVTPLAPDQGGIAGMGKDNG